MKYLIAFVLLVFSLSACAQKDITYLNNWKSHPVPTNRDTLNKYGFSDLDWKVYKEGDTVRVSKNWPAITGALPFRSRPNKKERYMMAGQPLIVQVDDGYLAGYNHGEFGGELYWFSANGKSHYKIADAHVRAFLKREGVIYAIEGLAHLDVSEGSILKLAKQGDKWVSEEYLKLPTAPESAVMDGKCNFIIMTSKSLLTVDAQANIKMLVQRGMWYDSLYPSTMVLVGHVLYAGMRAGVYQYDLASGEQHWLQP